MKTISHMLALSALIASVGCKTVDVETKQPSAKFSYLTAVGAPRGRLDPGVTWTGRDLIVWGGKAKTIMMDGSRGGVWVAAKKSWRPITSADAPYNRYQHSAVWTGETLMIWGGISTQGGAAYLSDGGIYSPEFDSWDDGIRAENIKGRAGHSAIWTGKEMVVWGGFDESSELGDGAAYNPKTRSWKRMPKDNAPTPRSGHSAFWTGNKMIVWGGQTDGNWLKDGAVFDPSVGVWMSMSDPGELIEADGGMSVAWVDGRLVVWGGTADGIPVNTGAIWNPESDEWVAMSTKGAPGGRTQHLAVSSGKQLIVFGGKGDIAFTDGATFSPAENRWQSRFRIRRDIIATQRAQQAVWAAGRLIIWGVEKSTTTDGETEAVAQDQGSILAIRVKGSAN